MIILPVERRLNWNHPPVVLIGIILFNILLFFLYQSGDTERYIKALTAYNESGYFEDEWPHYQTYLEELGEIEQLEELRTYHDDDMIFPVATAVVTDRGFYRYLEANGPSLFYPSFYYEWVDRRSEINDQIDSISSVRFGVKPNDLSVIDLFMYQFLHGDFMHLMGNMMFLMICGFVVEAVLGHLPFLGLYLLGGIVAGLSHAAVDFSSEQPLVGASGSLSAVMAMYLIIYRWQSIRFFYWFYLIVGYFRAPAMILLPVYIGKELISFYTDPDSNVAFMAHAGGFVAGALSVGALAFVRPELLKFEYIETPEDDTEPYRQQLAEIYAAIEKYRFDTAQHRIEQAIATYGEEFELLLLQYNLLKLRKNKTWLASLKKVLSYEGTSDDELIRQRDIWVDVRPYLKHIDSETLAVCGSNFSHLEDLSFSEEIFSLLKKRNAKPSELSRVATSLAKAHSRQNRADKQQHYINVAEQLALGA